LVNGDPDDFNLLLKLMPDGFIRDARRIGSDTRRALERSSEEDQRA
jgi:hypothetical protein